MEEKKNLLFNKIIKKKPGTIFRTTVEEPKKPLRIIPRGSVIIKPVTEYRVTAATLDVERSSEIAADSTKIVGSEQRTPGHHHENTPEIFDRKYIDGLLAQKTGEMESKIKAEKDTAYQKGYEQGKSEGFNDGVNSLQSIEVLLDNINKEVIASREQLLKNAEEAMGRLSLKIAEAVIGEAAIKLSGEILEYNLKRCLDILSGSGVVTIKVNPMDYEIIREKIDTVFAKNKERFQFRFEPDPSIIPGGCFMESPGGAIDGRIDNQFDLIKENFLQMI